MEAGSDAKPNMSGLSIAGAQVVPDFQVVENKGNYVLRCTKYRQK
jgi:hypothetical protein